jgi:hypothetical protein
MTSFVGDLNVSGKANPSQAAGSVGLEVDFTAFSLARLDWLSKADPSLACFVSRNGAWEYVAKTEQLKNKDDARWLRRVFLPLDDVDNEDSLYRFVIYDVGDGSEDELLADKIIGYAEATARQIRLSNPTLLKVVSDNDKMARKLEKKNTRLQIGHSWIAPQRDIKLWDGKVSAFKVRRTRTQEVPYIRRVKVAVVTRKVVPCMIEKRIRSRKLVQVQGFEEVEEEYTEFVDQIAVRDKVTWAPGLVEEWYTDKVPVERTRIVQKPSVKIEEVPHFDVVQVQGTKVVDVPGYRIDTIQSNKLVEQSKWEVYDLMPHMQGKIVEGQRVVRKIDGGLTARNIGKEVYTNADIAAVSAIHGEDISQIPQITSTAEYTRAPLYQGGLSTSYTESYDSVPVTTTYTSSEVKYSTPVYTSSSYTTTSGLGTRYVASSGLDTSSSGFVASSGLDTTGSGFVGSGDYTTGQHGTVKSGHGIDEQKPQSTETEEF